MLIICSNEHGVLWVCDDRLPERFGKPEQPAPNGTYVFIIAAFSGEPIELVFLQETASQKIHIADPKWMGIIAYIGVEITHTLPGDWLLASYPDLVSPHSSRIKLMSLQFSQQCKSPDFNQEAFDTKARLKYDLSPCQIDTAINYAKRIHEGCNSDDEFAVKLDSIFSKLKSIDRMHLSADQGGLDHFQDAMVVSALSFVVGDRTPAQIDADYFLDGLDLDAAMPV